VIERYDCSGAGDVDTKTILTPNEDGTVTGFDGTVFKVIAFFFGYLFSRILGRSDEIINEQFMFSDV